MKNFLITFLFFIFATNNILLAEEYTKATAEKCVQGNCVNGQGTLTWTDGTKYEGEFKDEKMTGQGTFTHKEYKYVGEFKDDLLNGQGTLTFADGGKYVGEFKDDLFNGQGTFTFADGGKYVGEFKDDIFNGQGTFTFADGKKYVGEFKDNKFNGQGTITFANGNKINGRWEDGEQVESETKFYETVESRKKRGAAYEKNEKYYEIYEEDSENKKEAKNAHNAAARCYNSLSLIDREKTNRDIRYSRQELVQAMTFERSENLFGGGDEKVSERAYNHAKTIADRFVGQNCL